MMTLRPIFLSLQLFLVFLLFNPFIVMLFSSSFDSYDIQRLLELSLLLTMSLQIAIDPPFRQHCFSVFENIMSYQKLLIFGFFILGTLSSLLSAEPRFAFMSVATYFALLIFSFSIAGWCSLLKEDFIKSLMLALILCFTVSAGIALASFVYFKFYLFMPINQGNFNFVLNFLSSPGYMNRRFFDDVQVFLIPILMIFFFKSSPSKLKQGFIFLLLSFCFTRGILSGSRIYFYEPCAVFILFPLLFGKKSYPFLGLQATAMVVGALIYFILYQVLLPYSWTMLHVIPTVQNATVHSIGLMNLDGRGMLWDIALKLIATHPLLGAGPLHYGFYAYSTETYAAHPHSAILVFAAEWGIPACALLLITSIIAFIAFIKKAREPSEYMIHRMGLTAALIGGFLMMSIDGLILMPAGQVMLAITVGLSLFYFYAPQNSEIISLGSKKWESLMLTLLVLAMAFIVWGVFPDVLNMPQMVNTYLAHCSFSCTVSPDYWSQGFIQFY